MVFRFEADFADSLRCIPMAVRLRLDLSGVKLKLSEWSKLGLEQRSALVRQPCEAPRDIDAFRLSLLAMVAEACGAEPAVFPQLPDPIWENEREIPAQVAEKAAALGVALSLPAWKALASLQRFALVKLSRPGHEGRNFHPALQEFGLDVKG